MYLDTFSGGNDKEQNNNEFLQPFEEVLIQSDNEDENYDLNPSCFEREPHNNSSGEESEEIELSKICQESFFEVSQQQKLHDEWANELDFYELSSADVNKQQSQHLDNVC